MLIMEKSYIVVRKEGAKHAEEKVFGIQYSVFGKFASH
jgi:hypothetical protein